jgi:phospho-N-acetylmuramoyl-pentapeptide-transferase
MIYYIVDQAYARQVTFASIIFAFILTALCIHFGQNALPKDAGRAYAVNGAKSAGKPRGAGIIFILTFILSCVIFLPLNKELLIYLILVLAAMISGFLDDSSNSPWGELKKGIIDFAIAVMTAMTYLNFNPNSFWIAFANIEVTIPRLVYGILIVILVWASINVTNCTDGVDGLCGTLSIITLFSVYVLFNNYGCDIYIRDSILIMIVSILGYLWYNASPSRLLMGDAGSRAIGIFLAIIMLKLNRPLLFLLLALVIILDGGLGLIKLTIMRVFKVGFLKNIRLPLHDHARKNLGWSDAQTVFRFAIIQLVICVAVVFFLMQ